MGLVPADLDHMGAVPADPPQMAAIVVAGGGASRLGGANKAALAGADGRTVLDRAIGACMPADPVIVVGPQSAIRAGLTAQAGVAMTCEENPPGSGPARAVAAGMDALSACGAPPECVVVLAGDMPDAGEAVALLRVACASAPPSADGVIAVAAGRRQWLLGVYRHDALGRACDALPPWRPGQRGESMRSLLGALDLLDVDVPPGSADDLDTWADVTRAGFTGAGPARP